MAPSEDTEPHRRLAEYVDRVDDEIQTDIEGTADTGEPVDGYACQRGVAAYQLLTVPSTEFYRVVFPYNAVQDYAVNREIDPDVTGEVEIELDRGQLQTARATLRDRVDPEEYGEIGQELGDRLLDPAVAVSFETDPDGFVQGFEVSRKCFPDRAGFDVAAFDRAVQAVVSVGLAGQRYLANAYDIQPVGEDVLAGGGTDRPDTFQ